MDISIHGIDGSLHNLNFRLANYFEEFAGKQREIGQDGNDEIVLPRSFDQFRKIPIKKCLAASEGDVQGAHCLQLID